MKLGVIAPITALGKLSIGTTHLLLTSMVLSDARYRAFYRQRQEKFGDYLILDNDAHENKASLDLDKLIEAAELMHPDEIVLPDVIRNSIATTKRSTEAYPILKKRFPDAKFMFVVQGVTEVEWLWCLLWNINTLHGINTIGIPRVYADDFGSWINAVKAVKHYIPQIHDRHLEIHLLGSPYNIDSASEVERHFPGIVRSTDTAKPVHYALEDLKFGSKLQLNPNDPKLPELLYLDPKQRNPKSRPKDFFSLEMSEEQIELAQTNIMIMEQSLGNS